MKSQNPQNGLQRNLKRTLDFTCSLCKGFEKFDQNHGKLARNSISQALKILQNNSITDRNETYKIVFY